LTVFFYSLKAREIEKGGIEEKVRRKGWIREKEQRRGGEGRLDERRGASHFKQVEGFL